MKKLQLRNWLRTPEFWLIILLAVIAVLTALGPAEKSLGNHVRVVYLHGVWVWASLAGFLAAGGFGLAGLILRKPGLKRWSRALGRTGLLFWITYLPISMWAMQTNWNGLYLSEPRWRLAVIFAVSGLLAQAGVSLLQDPAWASATNLVYVLALIVSLQNTQNVMHPQSPIFNSDALGIQLYFSLLFLLTLLVAWQVARWWHRLERAPSEATSARQNQ
jgi:hypothetical protein